MRFIKKRPPPVRRPAVIPVESSVLATSTEHWNLAVLSGASAPILATAAEILQIEEDEHFLPANHYTGGNTSVTGEVGRYLGRPVVLQGEQVELERRFSTRFSGKENSRRGIILSAFPSWRCSYCGQLQSAERLTCSQCGGGRK